MIYFKLYIVSFCLFFHCLLSAENALPVFDFIETFTLQDSIETNINKDSDILVICFAGRHLEPGLPPFTFKYMLKGLKISTIFLRDIQRAHYMLGLERGGNITTACEAIKKEIEKISPRKIVILGTSMGGYAALIFGHLLYYEGFPINSVHSFMLRGYTTPTVFSIKDNPQIELQYGKRNRIFSDRSPSNVFHIYYALDCPRDVQEVKQLVSSKYIPHVYAEGGHELTGILKKSGELQMIIDQAIAECNE